MLHPLDFQSCPQVRFKLGAWLWNRAFRPLVHGHPEYRLKPRSNAESPHPEFRDAIVALSSSSFFSSTLSSFFFLPLLTPPLPPTPALVFFFLVSGSLSHSYLTTSRQLLLSLLSLSSLLRSLRFADDRIRLSVFRCYLFYRALRLLSGLCSLLPYSFSFLFLFFLSFFFLRLSFSLLFFLLFLRPRRPAAPLLPGALWLRRRAPGRDRSFPAPSSASACAPFAPRSC